MCIRDSFHTAVPALCLAGLAVCGLFLAIAVDRGTGLIPQAPRVDALSTAQFGRALAGGDGYHYTPGSEAAIPPSHLHAALTGGAWLFGLRGALNGAFTFAFSAFCFLVTIFAVRSLFRGLYPRCAETAALFAALSGSTAFAAFLLDEVILFTALVLLCFAVAALGRVRWLYLLLPAVVLARPEGVLLPAVLCLLTVSPAYRTKAHVCVMRLSLIHI